MYTDMQAVIITTMKIYYRAVNIIVCGIQDMMEGFMIFCESLPISINPCNQC